MMHFTRLCGLYDDRHRSIHSRAHEVRVQSRYRKQRRYRKVFAVYTAVGENQYRSFVFVSHFSLLIQGIDRLFQRHILCIEHGDIRSPEPIRSRVAYLHQFGACEYRSIQLEYAAVVFVLF